MKLQNKLCTHSVGFWGSKRKTISKQKDWQSTRNEYNISKHIFYHYLFFMKKLLIAMFVLAWVASIGTNSFANSDCKNVSFDNWDVCVNIEKVSGKTFKLTTDANSSSETLRCGVLLADKPYKDVNCNGGTFTVSSLDTQLIKVFIKQGSAVPSDWDDKPSSASKWLFPQWNYDFDAEEWADSSSSSSSSSSNSSNGDLSDFTINLANSSPSAGDDTKITIKAVDSDGSTLSDYDGSNAKVTVAYRSSSSSSWTTTTSSTYFTIDDNTPNFSNGSASTYITFKKDYDYRITVTDQDDTSIYTQKTIYTDGSSSSSSSSNGDISDFGITLSDSTPSTNSDTKLTLKALDSSDDTLTDYDGSNAKVTIAYKSSSSSSWTTTTSSTYFTIDDNTPNFSNGSASTYITFKKNYQYRITVTDQDDSSIYTQKTITVGSSSSSSSNGDISDFTITLADSTPSTNSDTKLTLKAVDSSDDTLTDYDGSNAKVTIAYKSSSSSSWTTTTSSTYFTIDDNTPNFSNGSASTYITFKKNYQYRITVTDQDDSSIYTQKTITVGSSSSSSSNGDISDFTITLGKSTPSVGDDVKLTLKALDSSDDTLTDYDGSNAKITVAYRSSSSSSWTTTTSSTYFTIDDNTPNFSNGSASTYITFKKDYDYRITVTDLDDSSVYTQKTIYTDGSNSSSNGDLSDFTITLADSSPTVGDSIKLTVKAVDSSDDTLSDYDGSNAKITIAYRADSSDSWTTTTSSTYFTLDDNTPNFSNGSASTYIKFKKEYDYRITVTDLDDSSVYTQKTIYTDGSSSSSSDGFTSSQISTIKNLYNTWDSYTSSIESSSSRLRNNTTRQNMTDDLKAEMKKIINDDSSKLYDNYDEFETGFNKRYQYTTQNK